MPFYHDTYMRTFLFGWSNKSCRILCTMRQSGNASNASPQPLKMLLNEMNCCQFLKPGNHHVVLRGGVQAEPLKKKKKVDPALEKQKLEKKKKKIMKEIKRLQKFDKQFKPVAELETPDCLLNDLERRIRKVDVPEETAEERVRLFKEWSKYKLRENIGYIQTLQRMIKAQQKALDELRLESEELYQAAVQIDPKLIPLKYSGPTETPPKQDYPIPDGAYVDVSRKWT